MAGTQGGEDLETLSRHVGPPPHPISPAAPRRRTHPDTLSPLDERVAEHD